MAWLTKSRFVSGLQCHKRLWFEIHEPLEGPAQSSMPLWYGREFDEVVQQMHPGVVISRHGGLPAAIAETARILGQGAACPPLLYQAAFRADDRAVVVDVLRRHGEAFELVEVKATTQVKEHHLPDVAFQTLVLQRAGIAVERVFIGHVNNQFVLERPNDYSGLLVEADITTEVLRALPDIDAAAVECQAAVANDVAPAINVDNHCTTPYECPFLARCTAGSGPAPEYPVAWLPRGGKTRDALLDEGYSDLREVPAERMGSDMHRRVYAATVSGVPYFDEAATAELRRMVGPFAYLDFETISFVVPQVIGTGPYEQLPFQWSVHVEHAPGDIRHSEHLAIESFGDFELLARKLIDALPASGTIFAYNANFEAGILEFLAARVPALADALRGLSGRLFDLLPVTRAAYYHRDMQGSWSIKSVMPTISPDLTYERLGDVQDGGGAQLAFLELRGAGVSHERDAALRSALLKYCRHDTWAMVVLRRFLCGEPIAEPSSRRLANTLGCSGTAQLP